MTRIPFEEARAPRRALRHYAGRVSAAGQYSNRFLSMRNAS